MTTRKREKAPFTRLKPRVDASVEQRTTLRIRNSLPHPVSLVLEPWGEIIDMASGVVYSIEASGPPEDILEVESGYDHITVYAWPGATLWLYDEEGNEIGGNTSSPRTPVPSSRAG